MKNVLLKIVYFVKVILYVRHVNKDFILIEINKSVLLVLKIACNVMSLDKHVKCVRLHFFNLKNNLSKIRNKYKAVEQDFFLMSWI